MRVRASRTFSSTIPRLCPSFFIYIFHSSGAKNHRTGIYEFSSEELSLSQPSCRFDPKIPEDHLFLLFPAIRQIPESTFSATSPLHCSDHSSLLYAGSVSLSPRAFYTLPMHQPGHLSRISRISRLWPAAPIWVSLLKTLTVSLFPCSLISLYWMSS